MDNYCSPQWVDFTSTPDIPSDDYFEKNHEIYELKDSIEPAKVKMGSENKENIKEISKTTTNDETLKAALNIKNTPIRLICSSASKRSNKKCQLTKKITFDDIIQEAMEVIDICSPEKLDIFKKPVQTKNEVFKSSKFHEVDNNPVNALPDIKVQQVTDDKLDQEIESLSSTNSCNSDISANNLLKNNKCNLKLGSNNTIIYTPVNSMKSLRVSIPSKQEQRKSLDKTSSNKQFKSVTYQCRRQSLIFRRRSNPFISLAAGVHKFQNETPERFRTKCNKNLNVKVSSTKNSSSVINKSILAKSNIKRRSAPALRQKEDKDLKLDEMKDLARNKNTPKHAIEAPKPTITRRSLLNSSTKNPVRNKHVISTVVNNGSEIVVKKEKILFFDIPIHTRQKTTTCPIPFSFEYRDKVKKESKSQQLQPKDNKSVNKEKPQNIQTGILKKKTKTSSISMQNKAPPSINDKGNHGNQLETNEEACKFVRTTDRLKNNSNEKNEDDKKNVASTSKNLKTTIKVNKSKSMSSLKPYEKTEPSHSKDTKQSTSMSSKNSLLKNQDINKHKNTTQYNQTKEINQVSKQSSLPLCKEKSKSGSKKIETIQTKEDPNKMRRKCSSNNSINTNTDVQENKCPNINLSTSDNNLNSENNVKPKSSTIGMNSYERGKQRHEYDEKIRQKMKMEEEIRKKMEADKLAQEKLQVAMLRKQLEVKARPVPAYKPLIPIKSTKPLTEPQSPAWAYKKKAK